MPTPKNMKRSPATDTMTKSSNGMGTKSSTAMDKQVGERIRARRNSLGISQTELGNRVGVTFQQIQKYERGSNRVSVGRLHKIAEALQQSVDWFYSGSEGTGTDKASDAFVAVLQSAEGARLAAAWSKIQNPRVRHAIVQIAETLATAA